MIYDVNIMNHDIMTWVGLACASDKVRVVPPRTWALEEALDVLADRLEVDDLSPAAKHRSKINEAVRDLERDGSLVQAGHGMGSHRRPAPMWQLEHRAIAAAYGAKAELAMEEAGVRLAYLAMLSVKPSNTAARPGPES